MQQALKDEVTDFLGRERYALIIADGAPGRWKATRELWPRAGRVVDLPALISSVNDAWRRSRHVRAGPGWTKLAMILQALWLRENPPPPSPRAPAADS